MCGDLRLKFSFREKLGIIEIHIFGCFFNVESFQSAPELYNLHFLNDNP